MNNQNNKAGEHFVKPFLSNNKGMETVEEAASDYSVYNFEVEDKKIPDQLHEVMERAFIAGVQWAKQQSDRDRWIDALKQTPELIEGKDYSENVHAIINGELGIACYCWINDGENGGYAWANCHGHIEGDAEFDDEYDVPFWQPLPKKQL